MAYWRGALIGKLRLFSHYFGQGWVIDLFNGFFVNHISGFVVCHIGPCQIESLASNMQFGYISGSDKFQVNAFCAFFFFFGGGVLNLIWSLLCLLTVHLSS